MKKALLLLLVLIGISTSFLACHQGMASGSKKGLVSSSHTIDSLNAVLKDADLTKQYATLWQSIPAASVRIDTLRTVPTMYSTNNGGLFFIKEEMPDPPRLQVNTYELSVRNSKDVFMKMAKQLINSADGYTNYVVMHTQDNNYSVVTARHVASLNGIPLSLPNWKFSNRIIDVMAHEFKGTITSAIPALSSRVVIPRVDTLEIEGYELSGDTNALIRYRVRGVVARIPANLIPILNTGKASRSSDLTNALLMKVPMNMTWHLSQLAGSGVYYVGRNGNKTNNIAGVTSYSVQEKYYKKDSITLRSMGMLIEQLH